MAKRLFLLDGMALVYRAHFAFVHRPILTSQGVNTSALYGFANTLLEILKNQSPTHLAVAFDTSAPTERHEVFAAYKAQREEMPEDLATAIPNVKRLCAAMNIPVLELDGYEADDIIGTLVKKAAPEGFESFMVTPDKDFAQLVAPGIFIYKPGRQGGDVELLGVPEVLAKWDVERTDQVIDVLGLWGDASDNIPGVPGIGEKTAAKLLKKYDSVENLLAHVDELSGKQRENLEAHREQALLSKRLATINCSVPLPADLDALAVRPHDDDALKQLFVEFEFNSLGRRLFGDEFKAGRGFSGDGTPVTPEATPSPAATNPDATPLEPALKKLADVKHKYVCVDTPKKLEKLLGQLRKLKAFCFDTETTGLDPKTATVIGLSFSWKAGEAYYVPLTRRTLEEDSLFARNEADEMRAEVLEAIKPFADVFADATSLKIGHNLKFDLAVLHWSGIAVAGEFFDTMIAHSLIEPEQRHGMDYLSEVYLGYTPISITELIGDKKASQINMANVPLPRLAEYAAEDADVTWQLYEKLQPLLSGAGQGKVFYEIEMPLLPVLMAMEVEGIRINSDALAEFSRDLEKQMALFESRIHELAGRPFNLNSPKQLGEVLFDELKLAAKAKKTRTGQYATDEQTLAGLAAEHEIIRQLLDYRSVTKLKSTYADALPQTIFPLTGRVHTTFQQAATATGRLNSQNPNLQNIPIRTELGQEIRRAFVPRDEHHVLMSADYSQIELRIIASLSGDPGMMEAFTGGGDIHTATAARVFGVPAGEVTSEMRRKAKMVNFGIAYGISAFGLSQRLRIPRGEAAEIIQQYFASYPGIRDYVDSTIARARENGYVETVTGRRRYLRDITSANATVRGAAERNAINMPVQGTAADMIKLAMSTIFRELGRREMKTRLLLQVHDELVFDVPEGEVGEATVLVKELMEGALTLKVPVVVEVGTGRTWLEAH